eukprot:gene16495-20161_t
MVNEFAEPKSLYRAQLQARLGPSALTALEPRRYEPAKGVAALETAVVDLAQRLAPKPAGPGRPLTMVEGILRVGGTPVTGKQLETAWWLGRLEPARASEFGRAITRFAPGRTGTGLTDEIPAVAAAMVRAGEVFFRHHYGLWYDRRRIDHQLIRRPDGDVYPPFYEQPFARSGQGTAWDGM